MMKKTVLSVTVGLAAALAMTSANAQTLEQVQSRGNLVCGVSTGLAGFSVANDAGEWTGIDVDYCRALAAAIFGDPNAVSFTPLNANERFTALQSGEIDVLSRNTTWTLTRDTTLGLNFVGVTYYDGQGFLVTRDLGVDSALDLSGASVCIQSGTTTELNLADYFRTQGMEFEPVVFDTSQNTVVAFEAGRCDVLTSDLSQLAALRLRLADPESAVLLPETISKEPLGPAVRHGDDQWYDIAKWTLNAMILAEELGVNSSNVEEMRSSENPEIKRLLGVDGEMGAALGISNDWVYNIVSMVGNYGEIFDKNVGASSPLELARGLNGLFSNGGIQYSMPIR